MPLLDPFYIAPAVLFIGLLSLIVCMLGSAEGRQLGARETGSSRKLQVLPASLVEQLLKRTACLAQSASEQQRGRRGSKIEGPFRLVHQEGPSAQVRSPLEKYTFMVFLFI